MAQILQHPVIDSKITQLRSETTSCASFRRLVTEISMLMVSTVTANLATQQTSVTTPLETADFQALKHEIILVPILRAGLGMLEGFHQLLPEACVAHIGLARNEETLEPETYYCNIPKGIDTATVILLDPMLATGGSAIAAIEALKSQGAKHISFAALLAAPEGLLAVETKHPDVSLYVAAQDRELNNHGYICPGLGDAGDRIFGTV